MFAWFAITVEAEDGKLFSYPLRVDDHSSALSQLQIKGIKVAHLCKGKKHAAELAELWNGCYRANEKAEQEKAARAIIEDAKTLQPGYDFISSLFDYADSEALHLFENVKEAAEYLPDYKNDFDDFPACLDDPKNFFTVWNECVYDEISRRGELDPN